MHVSDHCYICRAANLVGPKILLFSLKNPIFIKNPIFVFVFLIWIFVAQTSADIVYNHHYMHMCVYLHYLYLSNCEMPQLPFCTSWAEMMTKTIQKYPFSNENNVCSMHDHQRTRWSTLRPNMTIQLVYRDHGMPPHQSSCRAGHESVVPIPLAVGAVRVWFVRGRYARVLRDMQHAVCAQS